MKKETVFLKVIIVLIGAFILGLCIFFLPRGVKIAYGTDSALLSFILLMYVTAIPFFIALYEALRILSYIENGTAFSGISVKSLKNIKVCAVIISGLYILGMPILFIIADKDDAPGIILMGMVVVFASLVIAVFSAVLQNLLKSVIEIKLENDLTVWGEEHGNNN